MSPELYIVFQFVAPQLKSVKIWIKISHLEGEKKRIPVCRTGFPPDPAVERVRGRPFGKDKHRDDCPKSSLAIQHLSFLLWTRHPSVAGVVIGAATAPPQVLGTGWQKPLRRFEQSTFHEVLEATCSVALCSCDYDTLIQDCEQDSVLEKGSSAGRLERGKAMWVSDPKLQQQIPHMAGLWYLPRTTCQSISNASASNSIPYPCATCLLLIKPGRCCWPILKGAVRVNNACDVFWQPEVKGLTAGIDQNKSRERVFLVRRCWLALYWSSVLALPAGVGNGSYVLNTTTAKSEFGTRGSDFFYRKRNILGSRGSGLGAGRPFTRGQHPTILSQKTSILWSTAEGKWQEIKILQRKCCRIHFISSVVSLFLFPPLMF